MSIEATLICIDNSEFSRNGDFIPSRISCQQEATTLIANAKLANQYENSVGILTLAGERVTLLHAPNNDLNNFLLSLATVKPGGVSDFCRGLQTAQFALKHRQNKNLKQRIICFIASPIRASTNELISIGKLLKKNNVSMDIINICPSNENNPKIEALFNAVNNQGQSHLLLCSPGQANDLINTLIISQILNNNEAFGYGMDGLNDFGIDNEADVNLQMALRISREEEEERQRNEAVRQIQERENAANAESKGDEQEGGQQ